MYVYMSVFTSVSKYKCVYMCQCIDVVKCCAYSKFDFGTNCN